MYCARGDKAHLYASISIYRHRHAADPEYLFTYGAINGLPVTMELLRPAVIAQYPYLPTPTPYPYPLPPPLPLPLPLYKPLPFPSLTPT